MNKGFLTMIILSLVISVLSGIALQKFVPMMVQGLSQFQIIYISALVSLLFIPFVVAYLIYESYWILLSLGLAIGSICGFISGYYFDCLSSFFLVAILSLLSSKLANAFELNTFPKPILAFINLGLVASVLNIFGHQQVNAQGINFIIILLISTLFSFVFSGMLANQILKSILNQ